MTQEISEEIYQRLKKEIIQDINKRLFNDPKPEDPAQQFISANEELIEKISERILIEVKDRVSLKIKKGAVNEIDNYFYHQEPVKKMVHQVENLMYQRATRMVNLKLKHFERILNERFKKIDEEVLRIAIKNTEGFYEK
jgi:hypothetical protein